MAYKNKGGIRIIGAILIMVSLIFLFFAFIGSSFVSVGGGSLLSIGNLTGKFGVSPVTTIFPDTFKLSALKTVLPTEVAGMAGLLTFGMIFVDILVVAVIVLCLLTGIMALIDRKFFTPLWASITYAVLCILFIIAAIVVNSALKTVTNALPGMDMGIPGAAELIGSGIPTKCLPTLWLFLGLICAIAPIFLLRRAKGADGSVEGSGSYVDIVQQSNTDQVDIMAASDNFDDELNRTVVGKNTNMQGVVVRVRFTDDSGTHIVRRQILTDSPLTIGRSERCKLVLTDTHASSNHASLTYDDLNGLVIQDNGSTNGVQVNGETIMKARRIKEEDTVRVGDTKLMFSVVGSLDELDGEKTVAAGERYHEPVRVRLNFTDDSGPRTENIILKETAQIGRNRDCEVQVDSNTVSHKHARLVNLGNGRIAIEDLGSANGILVNGEKIKTSTPVGTGDVLTLGSVTMRLNVGR